MPCRIIAGKTEKAAPVEPHDSGSHGIEKPPVVRDVDNAAAPVEQQMFKPCYAGETQVNGGSIAPPPVGLDGQSLCPRHAFADAAGLASARRVVFRSEHRGLGR